MYSELRICIQKNDFYLCCSIIPPSQSRLMRFNISIFLIMFAASTWASSAPLADPCTALHERSFCMDTGYCFGLKDEVSREAISCSEAYTDPSVAARMPETILDLPPTIKTVNSREYVDLMKCDSSDIDDEHLHSILESGQHSELISKMIKNLSHIESRLSSMFPFILYDGTVDGPVLGQLVDGAKNVSELIFAPLARSRMSDLVKQLRCALTRSNLHKNIRTYLDLYGREIQTHGIGSFSSDVANTVMSNLQPFVHAWLTANAYLGINFPLWLTQDLGIVTAMSKFDPLYTSSEEDKSWIVPVAEPALSRGSELLILPPIYVTGRDDFPLPVLDILSISEDGIPNAGNALGLSLVEMQTKQSIVDYNFLRAAIFYLRFHESVNDMDRMNFCTISLPIIRIIFEQMKMQAIPAHDLFGTNGISEYLNLCGARELELEERLEHILLPSTLPERLVPGTKIKRIELTRGTAKSMVRTLRYIAKIPVHMIQKPLIIVSGGEKPFDLVRAGGRPSPSRDNGATVADIDQYHSFLTKLTKATITTLYTSTLDILTVAGPATNSDLGEVLRGFGRVIALLMIEGDPDNILAPFFSTHSEYDLYFNSVAIRRGFCEVVSCNILDALVGKDELIPALELIRGVKILGRTVSVVEAAASATSEGDISIFT